MTRSLEDSGSTTRGASLLDDHHLRIDPSISLCALLIAQALPRLNYTLEYIYIDHI